MNIDVAILGAGISGLTAAFTAKKAGQSVRVIEASARVGGSINSEKRNGYLLEYGPNTVLPNVELMSLIDDLNLSSHVLMADPRLPRYIQFQNRLHAVPMSPLSFLKTSLLSPRGRLRTLAEPFIPKRKELSDESLMSFATRRFGPQTAERLIEPFVSGIWAGDAHHLSAVSTLPKLINAERNKGSVMRGLLSSKRKTPEPPRGLLSFINGLGMLTSALNDLLQNEISLNSQVQSIEPESNCWKIKTAGMEFTAKKLIITVPAPKASKLLEKISEEASRALAEIPYAPLVVLHLALPTSEIKSNLHAFGHLLATSEQQETLGCVYSSSVFPNRAPKDMVLLTVFLGGARFPHILESTDQELMKKAVMALQPILGFKKHPELLALTRYERAIPQYTLGHSKRVKTLEETEFQFTGLKFAGNYMAGVSVGDVVKQAMLMV